MRTNKQVEVFIFQKAPTGDHLFLIMKRIPARGGFWQPLTGGVEDDDSWEETLRREVQEETGITSIARIVDIDYQYTFDFDGRDYIEKIFGAEVIAGTAVVISHEHDEFRWVNKDEAMQLLKWPENKNGLVKLFSMLSTDNNPSQHG